MSKRRYDILLIVLVSFILCNCCTQYRISKITGELERMVPEKISTPTYEHIRRVGVSLDNRVIYEYREEHPAKHKKYPIASCTKTITALLIGIAIDKGFIKSVHEKVYTFFPEYEMEIVDSNFKNITIEHLLTMKGGLEWEKVKIYELENPVVHIFQSSLPEVGLQNFRYTSLGMQLLSEIIFKTTSLTEHEFAKKYLFHPLGIKRTRWLSCENGNSIGGFGLSMSADDLLKIGQLLLNKGTYNGTQVVNEKWVEKMGIASSEGGFPHYSNYALGTWIGNLENYDSFYAGGKGGQFIYVVPSLNLVAIMISDPDQPREHHIDLIENDIVPVVGKWRRGAK